MKLIPELKTNMFYNMNFINLFIGILFINASLTKIGDHKPFCWMPD